MRLKAAVIYCAIAAGIVATAAQAQSRSIHANIRGGGGDEGKCTFEVTVDGVAEVEIRGEQGYLRTISGNEATWKRLDCTGHFPNNPGDFRFKGVDGRGSQTLVRDPRGSGGVAVIRIEDPRGGTEGYTGDIIWRGGDSHWGGGGNWSSGGSGWDHGWNNSPEIGYGKAVSICQNQVSRVRGINPGSVNVTRRAGNQGGVYELDFRFRDRYNNSQSGQCTISGSGQMLNFNISGGGFNDRISHNQAMSVCEREVERRLEVGAQDIRVQEAGDPGNGNFTVNWQARRQSQGIRTGQCIVSPNGQISEFRKW
jgi:hypothetical protein